MIKRSGRDVYPGLEGRREGGSKRESFDLEGIDFLQVKQIICLMVMGIDTRGKRTF